MQVLFSGRPGAVRGGLMLCGLGLMALCGCAVPADAGNGSATTTPASTPSASAGTQDASGSTVGQDWQDSLGTGVTVTAPAPAAPGHDSPGAVVHGYVAALDAGHAVTACPYYAPSGQARCRKELAGVPASVLPTVRGFAVGYVAVDGDRALVGATGDFCNPGHKPECKPNRDPAAIFAAGKSFATLWQDTLRAPEDAYSLAPCIKVGSRWYLYASAS